MVVATVRPRRKPNTTSNAFGVERSDSLTLVTSWIASTTHQTGQWPPTGHAAVDLLAGTGTGTCSQRWVAGAHGETASPKICGWLTGSLSIAHARSTVVARSGGMSTAPAHVPRIRSLAQSASRFTTPFFPPLPGRPIARATRLIPLLVAPIAPGVVAVGTRAWPARLDPLGHLLRVPTRARARYSVTAPLRRLGSATFCIRLEARDTSHEACCDSSTRTAPESGGETSPDRHSPRSASIQLRWLPCPSSRPPETPSQRNRNRISTKPRTPCQGQLEMHLGRAPIAGRHGSDRLLRGCARDKAGREATDRVPSCPVQAPRQSAIDRPMN